MKRMLGKSGIEVAPFGFGGNVFGWTADEKMSFHLLDAFVDAGFNLVDTADMYSAWVPGHSGGESETILGRWLKKSGKRHRIVLATKVGMEMGSGAKGLSAAHIRKSVEDSLTRLQTDRIDLYQAHRDDPNTPLAETLEAFGSLVKAGKVRAIGASNYSSTRLSEALRLSRELSLPRFETLQPLYNLYDREEFERTLLPICQKEGLGVINYYSLAAGFLTGKYRTESDKQKSVRGSGAVSRYFNEKGHKILEAVDVVARRLRASPAQISLAWLMAQPTVAAPLASATNPDQLRELMAATDLKLDADALAELDRAAR